MWAARSGVATYCDAMAADALTGETTELLQTLIRNECVNDGSPDSGFESRNADTLQTFLEGAGLDVAVVNGQGALVEAVNLRTIVLRDEEGTVHVVPNGEVKTLSNRSKDFAYYVISIAVPFEGDPDMVSAALEHAGATLLSDPMFRPHILAPLEVYGVDDFKPGQLLGSVGGARTPEGAHIEFQIRSPGGEAVDPLGWLRRRTPA